MSQFYVNNPIFLEYSHDIKEEFQDDHYPISDNKVQVSETGITNAISKSNRELNGYIRNDKILDHIKTDLPSDVNDTVSNNVKIEDSGIYTADIKTEFCNELRFCNHCHEAYQDYCNKCKVLLHILNERPCNNRIRQLPKFMLEARESIGHLGIFSLKVVSENVRFGPFTGLTSIELPLRIKGGRFVVSDDQSEHLNWMQYINPAKNIYEQNLLPFQYDDKLYYCSTRRIQEGEELLVYFGEEYEDNIVKNVEMDFVPMAKKDVENVFACTFCCLGFSSKEYLAEHKAVSHSEMNEMVFVEELVQCPFCKIYLEAKEYFEHHVDYCFETNDRYCAVPTPEVYERCASRKHNVKQWKRGIYKCTQCKFRTLYSAEFRHHTNEHYQVKMHKCGICHWRYKTKEFLKAHVVKNHVNSEERDIQKYATKHLKESNCKSMDCGYKTAHKSNLEKHIREKHLKTNYKKSLKVHVKTQHIKKFNYKCTECEYKTNVKSYLEAHRKAKHLNQNDYKCVEYEYMTNYKANLKGHIKEKKYLKQNDYKCMECQYNTGFKSDLQRHIKAKHLVQNDYKCAECEFKTNIRSYLKVHIKTKHLPENDYKCVECEYMSNTKSNLQVHVKAKHLKQKDYKCTACEYKTNYKSGLNKHIQAKHLKEIDYKCTECEYTTNYKSDLKRHLQAKHLKENEYKCAECEFKTYYKAELKKHIEVKHLKENYYKCAECEFKTYYKAQLKKHIKAIHLKENEYKCTECDFKTYYKSNLRAHIKAKHLKKNEYKCMECDFKTCYKWSLEKHIKRHLEKRV